MFRAKHIASHNPFPALGGGNSLVINSLIVIKGALPKRVVRHIRIMA